jgi:hypothetical protein
MRKREPDLSIKEEEAGLSGDLAEKLERAEELLLEAFGVLKECMPPALAGAIATQVIEDLVSLESSQSQSH